MSNFDKVALANLEVGDLVAVKSDNPPNLGCAYFVMTVVKVYDKIAALALEGTTVECNLFDRETGQIVGHPGRHVEPVTSEVRAANHRAMIGNWASYRAEQDLRQLPYYVQAEVYHLVQQLLAAVSVQQRLAAVSVHVEAAEQ